MKTQLLEDFDESGSAPRAATQAVQAAAPAERPAAPPRPAVWQRPRQVEATAAADAVPSPALAGARTAAPQPTASGTTTVPPGDAIPDWLRERLARDAALQERAEWNGQWKHRLASWGAAGVLLALLAGGGLWLYEQSRVEGALVVVANTNPAPAAPAVPAPLPPAAQQAAPESSGASAVGGTAGPSSSSGTGSATDADASTVETQTPAFADRSVVPVATDVPAAPRPKHKRTRVGKRSEPEARADVREDERSYRQRYEETMMQCRAHGYDERQCLQRGCEMTRYGFACKG